MRVLIMKLNPDCVRDILIFLEDNLQISSELVFEEISYTELASQLTYDVREIVNTLFAIRESGFIDCNVDYSLNGLDFFDIYRITYNGYQFIESIRPEPVWKKVKAVSGNIGSFSFSLISQIANGVLSSLISGQLNP